MSYWAEVWAECEQYEELGCPAYEFKEETCPHGHKIKHYICNIPGYRDHDISTDCPICGEKE